MCRKALEAASSFDLTGFDVATFLAPPGAQGVTISIGQSCLVNSILHISLLGLSQVSQVFLM